jgi:hypothetical protein
MTNPANGSGIGQPVRRREDLRLIRGNGRYTAGENPPDLLLCWTFPDD